MLIAEANRLDHAQHKSVLKSLKAHIASLKAALAAIEADIAQLVEGSEMLRKKVALMQTVIGIGPISAMVVLAYLPDIGQLTKGQGARLAGLAPINNDSGKRRGVRQVEAGRTAIRRALYMAAGVAMRANPILKAFSDRLRGKGYPFKYVVTAVMRKLIVILNAVLRDGESWRVRRRWHKSQSELGTSTYPLKLSGMEALRRRVERLSRTAGTLTVRLAPMLPGRSLTAASTAARSIHSDQLGICSNANTWRKGIDTRDSRYLPRPRPRLA
jgi:hypothetical protein